MTAQNDASKALEETVAYLKALSYDELSQMAEPGERAKSFRLANRGTLRYGPMGNIIREFQLEEGTVYLVSLIGTFGLFRKRATVEVAVIDESGKLYGNIAPVYFERFQSGGIGEPRVQAWHLFVIGVGLAALVAVAIVIG